MIGTLVPGIRLPGYYLSWEGEAFPDLESTTSESSMSIALFSPISLRELTLDNRIVVSPMCQYSARDGSATEWHLMHLGQFSVSGPGLVMVEATGVEARGRISYGDLGLYADDNEVALGRVIAFCRKYGQSRLGLQLAHAGRKASDHLPWEEPDRPLAPAEGAWPTVGPSPVSYGEGWPPPQALDREGLAAVKQAFVRATRRAARLDVDLVELHAAHGYLLHEFLSPLSNHRADDYGGSRENRMRFPLEVFDAMRQAWPAPKPMGVRISATDYAEGGWDIEDSVVLAAELHKRGCDYIDVSGGGLVPWQKIPLGPGYQVPFAARIRQEVGITTMAVGLITQSRQAEEIIARGQADLVALARGMLYDPRWTWHAAEELGAEINYPPQYRRCHPSQWPRAFPHRGGVK
jgi:2,4-dienoyl-CoA reductase-like NADH-dependent reductase (Old Yellow Enzyme family)